MDTQAYDRQFPYLVIIDPGTDKEYRATQHALYATAKYWVERARKQNIAADVAKALSDGSWTYDF